MKMQIVAIKDSAVQAFMQPTFTQHVGAAIRGFSQAINEPGNELSKIAIDVDLYHLGEFDDQTGLFSPAGDKPQRLLRGVDAQEKNS